MRILLLDDDDGCREAVTMLLEFIGCQVEHASSGTEALNKFNPSLHDAVITDYQMPGMDGLEFAAALKKQYNNSHVILSSAYDGVASNDIDAVIPKPASINDFRRAIKTIETKCCASR